MRVLLLFTVLALAGATDSGTETENLHDILEKFQSWVKFFKKEYHGGVTEFMHRVKTFTHNLERMKQFQKDDPSATYSHMSPLMDLTEEEFKTQRLGLLKPEAGEKKDYAKITAVALPASFDWRAKGAVNSPKDQKQCGSCWSFGTVANIEGAYVVQAGGELLSLSEQELVDCSQRDSGCNGGLPDRAFSDMEGSSGFFRHSAGFGLNLESDYPYQAKQGTCNKDKNPQRVFISGHKDISQDEDEIAAALMQYGPLAIGINAGPMQLYHGGISDPSNCNPKEMDHAVNLVGFGEEGGKKYWIIRNSWGAWWGENGYYRIVRGVGRCGLNNMVSTAIVTKKANEVFV